MNQILIGREFIKALEAAGVLVPGDRVRRVVIDAEVNSAVIVHVERYADDRMLQVVPTLDGIEIGGVPR